MPIGCEFTSPVVWQPFDFSGPKRQVEVQRSGVPVVPPLEAGYRTRLNELNAHDVGSFPCLNLGLVDSGLGLGEMSECPRCNRSSVPRVQLCSLSLQL